MIRPRMALRSLLAVLLAACGLACSAKPKDQGTPPITWPTGPDWTMYQGNAAHTGYVPVTLDPGAFTETYLRTLEAAPLNPVACAGDWVYVTTNLAGAEKKIYALNGRYGYMEWTADVDVGGWHEAGPPAYSGGRVFFATLAYDEYNLYALAYDTGQQRFLTAYTPQRHWSYGPTIDGDFLYIAGYVYLYAISVPTGLVRWVDWLQDNENWTPAVDARRVYAYHDRPLAQLSVIDRDTGGLEFAIPDPECQGSLDSLDMAPVIGSQGNILVVNHGYPGRLVSFDLDSRSIAYAITDWFVGQLTLAKGTIYVLNGGRVEARREADGALLWEWAPPISNPPITLKGPMIATENLLFVGGREPEIYLQPSKGITFAIDLQSHEAVWTYPQFGHLALSAQNMLFITTPNGLLAAIRLK